MKLRLIKNADQHEAALREIERLVLISPAEGSDDAEQLAVLALLAENYEKEHFPIAHPTPVEAIRFRMEQAGLIQRDLEPYIGSRSKVSEVLNGKVPLSLRMIQALHSNLGIPADVLVARPEPESDEDSYDWLRFPVREMWKRGWIEATAKEVRQSPAQLAERFFVSCTAGIGTATSVPALFRRTLHHRVGATLDEYATLAWCARVLSRAQDLKMPAFTPGTVTKSLLKEIVQLSVQSDGPVRASEHLASIGIALVVEPHLPRTKLDGAAMQTQTGRPVVGMTLRYDRLDSFWFTLLHELAHLALHVRNSERSFIDDLDVASGEDRFEREADKLARDIAIPRTVWRRSTAYRERTAEAVIALARDLRISPAIVAGRLRQETGNYYLFNQLVGHRQVRPMFGQEPAVQG